MVPEFGAAVTKLEKGKFTEEPVKTQFGYHVILLEDTKPIDAPPLDEVKPQLTQQLQQQNLRKQLDALKAGGEDRDRQRVRSDARVCSGTRGARFGSDARRRAHNQVIE